MRKIRRRGISQTPELHILIVMNGDMPNTPDTVAHWMNFLKTADYTLHIVIHPNQLSMREQLIATWGRHVDLMVCDEEHHVNTCWGNGSLAFATLLAIQYALRQKGRIDAFRKVLFLQQDMPLYSYSILKEQLTKDNRSWFKFRDGTYPNWNMARPYDFNRGDTSDGSAGIDDFNWASAIFTLDVQHVPFFFKTTHSYAKEGTFQCADSPYKYDRVIALFPELQSMFDQIDGGYGEWDFGNTPIDKLPSSKLPINPCFNTDEYMFSLRFKAFFPGNEIDQHIRLVQDNVSEYVKRLWLEEDESQMVYAAPSTHRGLSLLYSSIAFTYSPEKVTPLITTRIENISEIKNVQIYLPRMVWWRNMLSKSNQLAYVGIPMCFNPDKLATFDHRRECSATKKKCVLRDNVYQRKPTSLTCEDGGDVCKQKKKKKLLSYDCSQQKIAQSVTYTDWSSFSMLPVNVLRGAVLKAKRRGTRKHEIILNAAELNKKLHTQTSADFYTYIDGYNLEHNVKLYIDGTEMKQIIWHPTEYGSVAASAIANAFNLLRIVPIRWPKGGRPQYKGTRAENDTFHANDQRDRHAPNKSDLINSAQMTWQFSLEKLRKFSTIIPDTSSFILDSTADTVMIGTFLSNNILSASLASGCLFIRKVLPGSNLPRYSSALLKQTCYVPDRVLSGKFKKKFDTEFLLAPRMFAENE